MWYSKRRRRRRRVQLRMMWQRRSYQHLDQRTAMMKVRYGHTVFHTHRSIQRKYLLLLLYLMKNLLTLLSKSSVVISLFATFIAFTLNWPLSCCVVLAEEKSGCGGFDRNREPQQSGSEVQEGDADWAGWAQAVVTEREVCVLCQNTSVSHILSVLNGNLILKT